MPHPVWGGWEGLPQRPELISQCSVRVNAVGDSVIMDGK